MATRTYDVKGMSCNHCKHKVTEAISRLSGVTGVEVDLGTGKVTVTFSGEPDDQKVREAVDEAGYEVV
ncbi:heavy-metal-associated domain-containing protein [Thermaerobacter sp. PB12/4term]|uniref:heavy-metal-associated domain-containing protein n=1 Tax=Thermaerobacter sp. PB12/4term TaxID=2293838 RepID=UPI000E328DEB|nr:copper ion binding protein [Thermaerobacter sp. PB12/4term]QIA27446.1 heavy-metal-associated domain-containing protein [Thermaerobacter sp. PB12/4term]